VAINWQSVMTPDSLKTEASVRQCLAKLDAARNLVSGLEKGHQADMQQTQREMQALSESSRDAKRFYEGFRAGLSRPGGQKHYVQAMFRLIQQNHDAIEQACRFLLGQSNKYEVAQDGQVIFSEAVSNAEVDRYNAIIERINGTMSQIQGLEQQQMQRVRSELFKARQAAGK